MAQKSVAPGDSAEKLDREKIKLAEGGSTNSIKDFMDNSTLHGIRYLNDRSIFRKLFWFLCVVSAFVFCVFQTIETLDSYYERTYSTAIVTRRERQQRFPRVSFCNPDMLNTEKYREYIMAQFPGTSEEDIEADINSMARNLRRLTEKVHGVNYSRYLPQDKVNVTRIRSFYTRNATRRSHLIEDMLLPKELFSCLFQSRLCNLGDFESFNVPGSGLCYTFQPRDSLVRFTGRPSGLRLLLDVGSHSYIKDGYVLMVGLSVSVHAHNTHPNMVDAVYVGTGAYSSLEVRRKQFRSLQDPYDTNCGIDELWKEDESMYRKHLCHYQCYSRILKERCNCTLNSLKNKNMTGNGDM